MEYWEFLVQKEGDRSWQPIKSPKIELAAGRYRVVVHSNRLSTDVEICVTHTSTDEMPPKRRSQKRSRRTNKEGLMVVIPFTFLKPGLWEFRCCGDVMSDLLGNSWQEVLQLYVLPKATPIEAVEEPLLSGGTGDNVDKEVTAKGQKVTTKVQEVIARGEEVTAQGEKSPSQGKDESELLSPATSNHFRKKTTPPSIPPSLEPALSSNPILEKSLQMLEEVLHEVLDPFIQEFEQPGYSEATKDSQILSPLTPHLSPLTSVQTSWEGIILTLDEDSLVVKPGELLTISGKVDLSDANRQENSDRNRGKQDLFSGILYYEIRYPQTSQLLLQIQKPLSQKTLPLKFSHQLEIPPDYNSCLLLGEVTLYGLGRIELAVQSFTVTADLDKLLGAIQLESEEVNEGNTNLGVSSIPNFQKVSAPIPLLDPNLLNLVNVTQSYQPIVFTASSGQSLPPLLSPSHSDRRSLKSLKSLDLPTFSKVQPSVVNPEEEKSPQKEETEANLPLSESLSPDQHQAIFNDLLQEEIIPEVPQLVESTEEEIVQQEVETKPELSKNLDKLPQKIVELETEYLDKISLNISPESSSIIDGLSPIVDKEELENINDLALNDLGSRIEETEEILLFDRKFSGQTAGEINPEYEETVPANFEEIPSIGNDIVSSTVLTSGMLDPLLLGPQPVNKDPIEVDRAFQSLNLENRFWSRINDLIGDTELSETLKFDLLLAKDLSETEAEDRISVDSETSAETEEENRLPDDLDPFIDGEEEIAPPHNDESTEQGDFDESIWHEETEEFGDNKDAVDIANEEDIIRFNAKIPRPRSLAELANIDWAAQEIVIDDDSPSSGEKNLGQNKIARQKKLTKKPSSKPKTQPVSQTDSDAPLPAPKLLIPTHELVSGEPIIVRVQVPCHAARLGVKLWIQDRQSRTLLDGPRWLMDLLPNGAEELEGITQLMVPFGTVEIRFEAISIDLDSERESHKISIDCVVVPPDLPQLSFDDF
ncbi:MAG TPA: hypothetical protein DEA78_08165 [Cyanobacteria bacterium UBA11159]|nr:hypothetical protein [Cyanobacteria bacterium UBA11367]HBE57165.1 hypothetical protein [Cyanobacteria bacterium UBA11366]HBR73676.1 hypothetical protein [Cyanobacteria bacterium UBA11159]HBS71453.1 hypothetical protein [Cyanobacteria bacterium UBA11153]HCA94716.1 hypothetical protein [Cyanobacteria bacterium UBA9226]